MQIGWDFLSIHVRIHVQSIFHSVIKAWESKADDLFVQNVAMGILSLDIVGAESGREWGERYLLKVGLNFELEQVESSEFMLMWSPR